MTEDDSLSPQPARGRAPDGSEARWRRLTAAANAAFEAEEHEAAARTYRLALTEARRAFRRARAQSAEDMRRAAPMLVISGGNLARNEAACGRAGEGLAPLRSVVSELQGVMADAAAAQTVREACARNLPRALLDLVQAMTDAGCAGAAIDETVRAVRSAALTYWNARAT